MNLIEHATDIVSRLDQANARLASMATEHAEAIAAKDAQIVELQSAYAELSTYKTAMEARVSAVLQSGDPAQYEALAVEFLTPLQQKLRAEKEARLAAIEEERAAIHAELGL